MFRQLLFFPILAAVAAGCATQQDAMTARDRVLLENRIEELEATQARLRTRVVALEKSVNQLEDKITLMSRRASLDPREVVKIEPGIVPGAANRQIAVVRPTTVVTPAVNDDDEYQEIVISDEKKRAYFGNTASSRTSPSTTSSGPRKAYDNITDERLPSMTSGSKTAESVTTAVSPSGSVSPMSYYQEGIDLYRRGLYAEGRQRFEQFLATNPEVEYVDNALYWIGECYYGQGMYNEAAGYFHKIIKDYPKTSKVPDALLKVSLTYQQLGRIDSAREMLRYLMEAFPGTEAARLGKEKYETLNLSGQ